MSVAANTSTSISNDRGCANPSQGRNAASASDNTHMPSMYSRASRFWFAGSVVAGVCCGS
jgi:hypothetical protein